MPNMGFDLGLQTRMPAHVQIKTIIKNRFKPKPLANY